MTHSSTSRLGAVLVAGTMLLGACSSSSDESAKGSPSEAVVEHYADGVYASYNASVASAEEMNTAIKAFTADPTEETLAAAKQEWLDARDDYLPTESFRFYDGPIDNPDDGPEGRINAWPMDEAYVDYVEGDENAGIINNADEFPEVTEAVLVDANENGGETNISTGWHAIEFLLWGQDLNETGPGERPATDYTTAANADRRIEYLNLLGDVLVADLKGVTEQWDPEGDDNYRSEFVSDPEASLALIFRGIGALTVGELSGERIAVAIETKDEEDEHSCFSDNTNADVVGDIVGINNVYLGTYPGIEDGPGLDTLIKSDDAETADALTKQIDTSLELANNVPEPFDRMVVGDSAPLQEIVDSLSVQGRLIATAAKGLNIEVDTGV